MRERLLAVQELSAWYQPGQRVLDGLSMELKSHEIVGLIGLNGAGKTTLISLLSGLHEGYCFGEEGRKTTGFWFHETAAGFRDSGFKRCRYTVFAEDHAFAYFTFREYLSYVLAAYGKEPQGVEELVEGFQFEAYEDSLLGELSTGNRKKAFLITAFALGTELLFLDEPVNGLDFQSTEFLYRQMAEYKKRGTILFASQILESITLTADRALVLKEGRIDRQFDKPGQDPRRIREALYG